MRPRIEGSVGDDCMEDVGYLRFVDENLKSNFLTTLGTMRKHRLFCDVILNVGNTDIHAHRNVLACVSPHLMELFSAEQKNGTKSSSEEMIPSYRLNGYINKVALQILVDYAYTAQMDVPDGLVKDVYLAAWQLKIDAVVNECARHLIKELCTDSCIEIRSLPGIGRNKTFVQDVDSFIAKEFHEVSGTPAFLQLQCVQIDVLYQTKQEMTLVTHASLCRLVLDWIKRQVNEESVTIPCLIERSHLLYLALDNSLQDCSILPTGHEVDSDIVQDYKRIALKCPQNKTRSRKALATPGRPRVLIYSRDIGEREDESASMPDWNLIGSSKVGDNTFVALCTLNGHLTRISIQLRLNSPPTPSPINTPDVASMSSSMEDSSADLFCEVAAMSGPRCGLGVAELDGKLIVCGGYDRGECLKMVESYCPDTNTWTQQSSMIEARGRVQVAVVDGTVYAVGGSNGTTELDTVECLDKITTKWKKCCRLPLARSNAGVCELNGKIYCIGGWNGQSGIRQCDVYNPEEDKWTSIAPLHTGRYQVGVAAYNGKLWAVGGSDAWNCLNSVETYDPATDQWTLSASLLTARRGFGLAEFNGKIYAVGGSDGSHSLCTTEIYDEETKTWVLGPNLITPRSNVSVIVVKDKLYAIGGFSGKTFLNTMEYLDPNLNEWTTFVPQQNNTDIVQIVNVLTNGGLDANGHILNGEKVRNGTTPVNVNGTAGGNHSSDEEHKDKENQRDETVEVLKTKVKFIKPKEIDHEENGQNMLHHPDYLSHSPSPKHIVAVEGGVENGGTKTANGSS